ncbi:hypothetical protein [Cohnella yongneupensis]|uniref:Uncharacterized protein n=1 Tax=Cohnella yongneupensis TaxID=425006 RepID=A0ABW0R0N6_9BACL
MSKFIERWEKTRQRGKRSYILKYGVLYIGMITTLLITIPELIHNGKLTITYFVARLLIFPTVGAMIVGQRWDSREQKYAKLKANP